MNLRARILGLMTLSALTLLSCEEDISTIGLPPESNLGIFFAEVPLGDKTTQVWVKGVNTRNTSTALVGAYQDPNLGLVEAKNYSEVGLASATYDGGAQLDSVVFQLRVSAAYGNQIENVDHNFEIFQLADSISLSNNGELRSFTASTTEPIGQKIGDMTFQIDTDSIGLAFSDTNIDLANGFPDDSAYYDNFFDSQDQYIYLNKTRLDQTFGASIFNELKTNQYDSAAEIAGLIKGVHVRPANTNGAVISYDISDNNSGMVFYYTEAGESKSVLYPLSSIRSFNNFTPNEDNTWTGSDFDDLSEFYEPYTSATNKSYLQSGTNLLMKVDLSQIRAAMRDTVPNALVQSAEIIFSGGELTDELTPPPNVIYWLTSTDSLANEKYIVANPPSLSNSPVVATFNDALDGYKVEVPLFINSLSSADEFEFDQLIVAPFNSNQPTSVINNSISLPQSSITRFVLNKENLRLRFYYTVPDKDK